MRSAKVLCFFVPAVVLLLCRSVSAETISLPLSIDPQLLQSMITKSAFTEAGRKAVLLDDPGGCNKVVLSEPRYDFEGDRIHFETRVLIKVGFEIGHTCILPWTWEGYVSLTQVPVMNERWVLSFRTLDSRVLDEDRQPARIMGAIWRLIQTRVFEYLNQLTINLAPPVEDLRAFTLELFPPSLHDRAQRIIDSFRPGRVGTRDQAVSVEILTDIEDGSAAESRPESESLTRDEAERFISMWETWDSYFVRMIESLPREKLAPQERALIMEVLLEARYRFADKLLEPVRGEDFVRKEFVDAWSRLSPVFRKRMSDDPARPLLDYLAFFTASDALVVLDSVGPGLGIDLSKEGLIRLARLVSGKDISDLPYELTVDPDLRSLLGLGDPLPFSGPAPEDDSMEVDPEGGQPEDDGWFLSVKSFFVGKAYAQTSKEAFRERISAWLVPKDNILPYLTRVRALLNDASRKAFGKADLDRELEEFYKLLIVSTAWQESCFRQFTVIKGKVTYLRSYNGTSVGIMQINERVWRGIYDEKHLRWDISYNAAAGCEILGIYLRDYALPRVESADRQTLARLVYSMYYGGPGQMEKCRVRLSKGRPNVMDRLFLEKYEWAKGNQWEKIDACL